jgi:hypothetical protein
MDNKNTRVDEIRKQHLDKSATKRLDFRKEQRMSDARRHELERKKMDLATIEREIVKKKRRIEEIHYILRRLKTEETRADVLLSKEQQEDKDSERNFKEGQEKLRESTSEVDEKLKEVVLKITEEKKEIAEHERILKELERQNRDLERDKDRQGAYRKGVLSRLIKIFEREKKETVRADELHEKLAQKQKALRIESANAKAEMEILLNKVRNLQREMRR